IQNHWSPAGVLPLVSPSNNNRNGYTNKMRVWWKSVKEGDFSFQIDRGNHSASICSSNCLDTINIPLDISIEGETYIVTSIGNSAFSGCESLTTINIPEGIINIGMDAFRGCTNLTNITFPSSISNIGKFAFYGCTNLISPIYNSSMFIYLPTTHIGAYTIPENIENIAGSAFSGCTNLTNITIPSSVKSIGVGAFDSCLNLTTIKWHAQSCCDMLSCPFSNSVSSINIADGVEHIPAHLCDGLTEITSIIIPSSVRTIGDYAFANINNRKISNLVLPSEIISIGDYAFAEDTYIEQIDFGKNIEYIGAYAFHNCSRVLSMSCLAEVTPDVATNALSSISSNADLYILSSALKKYQVDSNWNRFLLKPLGATETTTNDVNVEPGDNTAVFTWPTNNNAASYTIEITKDGEVFCTLIFNANGQLTGIAFAPSSNGQSHAPSAILTANGMQFTVTGLDVATNYAFSLTTKDSAGVVIASYSGTFGTTGAPQGIDNPSANLDGYKKLLRNGQILILRGDKTYTLTGQEIR
ncbi:MAG: leucine-rich repeat domain-containing protein, partial [Alphaproteobacteria bacterium]|nr:leucine-rich repeat domain-containing protein [Alphaproteobacteria bacterium]